MFAHRTSTRLAAAALLALTGVMAAGAGPASGQRQDDAKWRVNISFGDRTPRDYRHERAPRIIESRPISLELQAFQAGDTVVILARGENATPGFTTSLQFVANHTRHDGRADVALRNTRVNQHGHFLTQVCTPFAVSGSFNTRERLSELHVTVAGETRCIPVQCVERIDR